MSIRQLLVLLAAFNTVDPQHPKLAKCLLAQNDNPLKPNFSGFPRFGNSFEINSPKNSTFVTSQ
jgi:hypothetical protein